MKHLQATVAEITWDEVDFHSDVLVDKSLNMNPLIIVDTENSVDLHLINFTLIMINLDPISVDKKRKKLVSKFVF